MNIPPRSDPKLSVSIVLYTRTQSHGLRSWRGQSKAARALTLVCASLTFFLLAGCGGTSSSSVTPLALSPAATASVAVSRITPTPATAGDWPMYHADQARTGFVAGLPDPQRLTSLWNKSLDGAVYAEPLVVKGLVIAASEQDTLYALNPRTGQVQWQTNVGTPVSRSTLPCGDIDPLGITGTPVYDPQTGLIFAVAEIQGPAHILVGLDAQTGQVKVRRSADAPGSDAQVEQERGALALSRGTIYIPYGGLDGDCGDYHGLVVASRTDGTGSLLVYQVPSSREAGIWSTPGPLVDAQGNLYVSVGNGASTGGNWDNSDSILRLSPTLQFEDGFAPQSWASDNASDLDLGSMGPVLLPGGLVYADGKSNQGYLLHADHLGGIGGQIQTLTVCTSFGGAAVSGQSLYLPCVDGVRQLMLTAGGAQLTTGWQASSQIHGSPVIGGQTLYSLDPNGGVLYALNLATGQVRATISVGQTSRFATPTLGQGTVYVGTLSGVTAVNLA